MTNTPAECPTRSTQLARASYFSIFSRRCQAEFEAGGLAARRAGGGGGVLDDVQQGDTWKDFGTRETRDRENILKPSK